MIVPEPMQEDVAKAETEIRRETVETAVPGDERGTGNTSEATERAMEAEDTTRREKPRSSDDLNSRS